MDPQTRDALEGYFLEDSLRLFQLSGEDNSKPIKLLVQEKQKFIEQFGRTKAAYKRSGKGSLFVKLVLYSSRAQMTFYLSLPMVYGKVDTFLQTYIDYRHITCSRTRYFQAVYKTKMGYVLIYLPITQSEIAIAYTDGSIANLKVELSNSYTIPHMLGFLTPDEENHR